MEITQTITGINKNPETGYMKRIHYTTTATEGSLSCTRHGYTEMPEEPETLPAEFIPYTDLTEAQVKAWVIQEFGSDVFTEEVENCKNILQKSINRKNEISTTPW
tara:strand:- start:372 stop:686 length:315 start_codon:yes stop_codon:yes gene_type:complete